MEKKPAVIQLIGYGHALVTELTGRIPEQERRATGRVDAWAYKDHLTHLAYWMDRFHRKVIAREAGLPPVTDLDGENARIWELHHADPWEAVQAWIENEFTRLEQTAGSMDEGGLMLPDSDAPESGRKMWVNLLDTGLAHTISHVSQVYKEHGDLLKSVDIMQKVLPEMLALDDLPRWQGVVRYNLACLHAQAGFTAEALRWFNYSLEHYDALAKWAGSDPDMKPLWNHPDFIIMTKGAE